MCYGVQVCATPEIEYDLETIRPNYSGFKINSI